MQKSEGKLRIELPSQCRTPTSARSPCESDERPLLQTSGQIGHWRREEPNFSPGPELES